MSENNSNSNAIIRKSIKDLLQKGHRSQRVIDLVRHTQTASLVSKAVNDTDINKLYDQQGNRMLDVPDPVLAQFLNNDKSNDIRDAETAIEMLPDLELSRQILISSILSPKGLMDVDLIHNPPMDLFPNIVTSELTEIIKECVDSYKIKDQLYDILSDALFMKGSHPIAVIPENSLDELINNNRNITVESLGGYIAEETQTLKLIGLLGSKESNPVKNNTIKARFATENLTTAQQNDVLIDMNKSITLSNGETITGAACEDNITVTDNPSALNLANLWQRLNEEKIIKLYGGPATESFLSDKELENLLYQNTNYSTKHVVRLNNSDQCMRLAVGEPLIYKLPPESVCVVHTPGDPADHIGYFIVIDEDGNPVTRTNYSDNFADLNSNYKANRTMASQILERSRQMYFGRDSYSVMNQFSYSAKMYSEIVETELVQRLRNGIYKRTFNIKLQEHVMRVMFSRALKNMHTQLLFIPAEMVTYFAFNHDQNGIGYSLLDSLKIVNSLAIQLQMADVRAAVYNSINRTKVDVRLDEDDPDPAKRMEQIKAEFMRMRSSGNNGVSVGVIDPVAIEDWLNKTGVYFAFSGAKALPEMSIDISESSTNQVKSDTDLNESLKAKRTNKIGLTPEMLDEASSVNFAESLIQKSLMFSRRVLQLQKQFSPMVTDTIKKRVIHSPKTWEALIEIIIKNLDKVISKAAPEISDVLPKLNDDGKRKLASSFVSKFLDSYDVSFPEPDNLSMENKIKSFEEYSDMLDKSLEYIITPDSLTEVNLGEMADQVDYFRNSVKGVLMREWMIKNDFLSEAFDCYKVDEDGKPEFDLIQNHLDFSESVGKVLAELVRKSNNIARSMDSYAKMNDIDDLEGSTDYSSSSSDSDDSDDDDSGDDGFGFDFGGDSEEGDGEDDDGGFGLDFDFGGTDNANESLVENKDNPQSKPIKKKVAVDPNKLKAIIEDYERTLRMNKVLYGKLDRAKLENLNLSKALNKKK